jgi:hypothetical protein
MFKGEIQCVQCRQHTNCEGLIINLYCPCLPWSIRKKSEVEAIANGANDLPAVLVLVGKELNSELVKNKCRL